MTTDTMTPNSPGPSTGASTNTSSDAASAAANAVDPRPLFAASVEIAEGVIAGVRSDQLALPSPCVEYDVAGLLDHLVFVLYRVAALGRGDEAFAPNSMADAVITHDNWAADWKVAAAAVDDAWSDDSRLANTVVLPWATMTGREVLAMYVSEITTHTWDVAKATGQHPVWDDTVCQLALHAMHRDLPMVDRTPMWEEFKAHAPANFQFDAPFANAVAVGTDAPLIEQLVAWTGRQP